MGRSKDIASGSKFVDASGDTMSGTLVASDGINLGGTGTANKLSDYEIGTWTPVLTFNGSTTGITYGDQFGSYTKVGRLVHIKLRILLTSKGTSSGQGQITGAPFVPVDDFAVVSFEKGGIIDTWNAMNTASNYRYAFTQQGVINLYKIDGNAVSSFADDAASGDFTDTSDLRLTITFNIA